MTMTLRQSLAYAILSAPREDVNDLCIAAKGGFYRLKEWAETQMPKLPPEAFKEEKK